MFVRKEAIYVIGDFGMYSYRSIRCILTCILSNGKAKFISQFYMCIKKELSNIGNHINYK